MAASGPPILVVGVAHVVDLAAPLRRVLGKRPLDGIAVELDIDRFRALSAPAGTSTGGGGGQPMLMRLWGMVQRRLGDELGVGAGAEMRTATQIAAERQLPVLLIDDPIRETLFRLLHSLSLKERVALFAGAIVGLFLPGELVGRQLDAYQAEPTAYTDELRRAMPGVAKVLLDDRNEHMADRLVEARGRGLTRIAAVIGDAHLVGLCEALQRRGVGSERIPFSELNAVRAP
ncbi:MAG: TraB/GumN family protein [Thermoplasmata archaeon]|nr:TraB/GumN family protein [Thermoplasmata archaeon]